MRETRRQTQLLPSDGPIGFKSELQSIISKTRCLNESPHQLDMMTKTLRVRDDTFPCLSAVQVYLSLDIIHLTLTFPLS